MGDSDDDYMSNDFLEQIQDVKPGLFLFISILQAALKTIIKTLPFYTQLF